MFKRSQIGRSMIEMLGVLAIIGVLSVGGLAGYAKAMRTIKLNDSLAYFNLVKMAIREREVSGTLETGSSKHKCTDLTGIELPRGMTKCQYNDQRDANPTRLFIRLETGELLKEFGKQVKTNTDGGCTSEQLASGTCSWYGVRYSHISWWSSYFAYTGYLN